MNIIILFLFSFLYVGDMYFINKDITRLRDEITELKKQICNLKIKIIEKE